MSVASPARPYRVDVPPSTIADLKLRLRHTRWPDEPTRDWRYGASPAFIRELVAYWIDSFDWSLEQARINTLPHFQASIRGRAVHFIHARGRGQHPLPIVLTHGWPSTFLEMSRLIPLLTSPAEHGADPADSFDVIVPSLPGFGFSQPLPIGAALDEICATWHELLTNVLGYRSYGAHGGDIGASVTARLAALYPESLTAIHLTSVSGSAILRYLGDGARPVSGAEREFLDAQARWYDEEGGYAHLQRTRPQTLAFALSDSPVGLCAWIVEKLRAWSDCGGDVERVFSKDDILTGTTIYWITETISSSMRMYFEMRATPWQLGPNEWVATPTGVALFPADIAHPPREWAERVFNVVRWTELARGGHFPAHEQPALLAHELRELFRPLRRLAP